MSNRYNCGPNNQRRKISAPQVVPQIAAPQGPHSVQQTATRHVTPNVTPQMATQQITRPAPQQFAPSSGPAVRYVPPRNLAAMHVRLAAMLQAVRAVRPALEKLYQSLNDE